MQKLEKHFYQDRQIVPFLGQTAAEPMPTTTIFDSPIAHAKCLHSLAYIIRKSLVLNILECFLASTIAR